ncbi:kinase-like protein, partial [Lindgomyces ingoldianus]
LYFLSDYKNSGLIFWYLEKEGRFSEPKARFYIAEIILALRHLHDNDIVYRDLGPGKILLDNYGHIVLSDFGLSVSKLDRADDSYFDYLSPEIVLTDEKYIMTVDFWSLGVLPFDMGCGWSSSYSGSTEQMCKNIPFGKTRFHSDAWGSDGKDLIKRLLNRNQEHRPGAAGGSQQLMDHWFFSDIDWDALGRKVVTPPFTP